MIEDVEFIPMFKKSKKNKTMFEEARSATIEFTANGFIVKINSGDIYDCYGMMLRKRVDSTFIAKDLMEVYDILKNQEAVK